MILAEAGNQIDEASTNTKNALNMGHLRNLCFSLAGIRRNTVACIWQYNKATPQFKDFIVDL